MQDATSRSGRPRGPKVFLVLAVLATVAAFLVVRQYLAPVILAVTIGYVVHPVYRWFEQRLPKRWPAALIVLLLVGALILLPFVILALLFIEDARRLAQGLASREDVEQRVSDMLANLGVPESQVDQLGARIVEEAAQYLVGALQPIASMAAHFVLGLLVFFILLFYVLVDGHRFIAFLRHVIPAPDSQVQRLMEMLGQRVRGIMYGTFGVSIVQGIVAGLGWWLLGMPAPFFWGFVMLVLSVVPVIGAFVVLLPAAIWAFAQGDMVAGIGLLVLNFVMVGVIDDILRPYVVGRSSGVHAAWILLGILGGLTVFGVSGLILGPLLLGIVGPLFSAWSHPEDGTLAAAAEG